MLNWLNNLLVKKLNNKKHEITRKKWQIAKLEATLKELKENQNIGK